MSKFGGMSNLNYVDALLTSGGLARTVGNIAVARLDGSQEVPPGGSPATGSPASGLLILRRNPFALTQATVSLSLNKLTSPVTAVSINGPALPGANAPACSRCRPASSRTSRSRCSHRIR